MPGKRNVEQNLFLAYVMLDKTYSWHRLCSTKPIPGIRYVGQNHIWDLVVKRTRCNKGRFWPQVRNKFCCHYNLVKYQYLQEI